MSIPFHCPECASQIEAPAHLSGDLWQCPACDSPLRVPGKMLGQHPPRPTRKPAAESHTTPAESLYQGLGILSFICCATSVLVLCTPLAPFVALPLSGIGFFTGAFAFFNLPAGRRYAAFAGMVFGFFLTGAIGYALLIENVARHLPAR